MSIALMTIAWQTALPLNQKAALLAMADWANDNGTSIHPSIFALSERLTCSERTAQRLVRELEAGGWVAVIGNANGGAPGSTRRYSINVRKLRAAAAKEEERRQKSRRRVAQKLDNEASPFDDENGCQIDTGDKLTPVGRVTNQVETGDKSGSRRVTNQVETGDTGVTQSTIDPSIDPPKIHHIRRGKPAAEKPVSQSAENLAPNSVAKTETELQAACRATWAAYSAAYAKRYGTAPVRNASVSSRIKQFVQRIGYDESPAVAGYFVDSVTEPFVLRKVHDVGLLLSGAEGYRTQWASGRTAGAQPNRQEAQESRNRAVANEWLQQQGAHT